MYCTIYVDDFLIFTKDRQLKQKLKAYLCEQFKMKDLDPSVRLGKSMGPNGPEEEAEMKKVPFKEAVGCLSFAAQVTRPDISYAVNAVSQFCSNTGRQHWEAVKKIISFLKGTTTKKLEYSKRGSSELVGFSDADWGGDPDNRMSTTGYVFTMQGGAISWNVKKQPTVALSSCEAEYMTLSRTIQEAMWWTNLRSQIFEEEPVRQPRSNQHRWKQSVQPPNEAREHSLPLRARESEGRSDEGEVHPDDGSTGL
ncbi:uncharacterized protein LOC129753844 [Uranotaenia lowii]|uniref:uncharacterized protein LOC129753844 n=1 Tax=Uranotaenia lowii TaxID=190385 RepID=UPI002478E7B0|nr:uncharacterized protein LOC129753844 [Uranotaenia lowii]